MRTTTQFGSRFGIPEPVIAMLAALITTLLAAIAIVAIPQAAQADPPGGSDDAQDEVLGNNGQCPGGTYNVGYGGGTLGWTADDDYAKVILVGGPPNDNNQDEDGRNKEFFDVDEGDYIERDFHNISHVCVTDAPDDPSYVTITKTSSGQSDADFTFQIWEKNGPQIGSDIPLAIGETSAPVELELDTWHYLKETGLPEGWTLDDIWCDQNAVVFSEDVEAGWIKMKITSEGVTANCTFDNDPPEYNPVPTRVTILKTGEGDTTKYFDFTLMENRESVVVDPLALGDSDGPFDVDPDSVITITETGLVANAEDGWVLNNIRCQNTQGEDPVFNKNLAAGTVQFTIAEGSNIECYFINNQDKPDLDVTKTVAGVDDSLQWRFDITLTSDTTGRSSTDYLTGTGTETSGPLEWDNLVPGNTYILSEATSQYFSPALDRRFDTSMDDWQPEWYCYDPATQDEIENLSVEDSSVFAFTAKWGQSIVCDVENTADPAVARVVKTLSGAPADFPWEFNFELSDSEGVVSGGPLHGVGLEFDGSPDLPLVPGTVYTITELDPDPDAIATPAWICWDGEVEDLGELFGGVENVVEDLDDDPYSFTFLATPGLDLTCGVVNYYRPQVLSSNLLTVTKEVAGVDSGVEWEFTVKLSSASEDLDEAQTVSGTGPSVSDNSATWTNLTVGASYVLSEGDEFTADGTTDDVAGSFTTTLECTGVTDTDDDPATVTFTVTEETTSVTCELVNTLIPVKVLAATGVNGSPVWMVFASAGTLMLGGAAIWMGRRRDTEM